MDGLPQGLVSFPGITQWNNATFTLGQGIFPSVGVIEVPAVDGWTIPQSAGPLSFFYEGSSVTLQNCKVTSASFSQTASGAVITLQIMDRRRRWQFGEISGRYNVRLADGISIQGGTEKTPQQLAKLCCDAMGESNPDLTQLPNGPRPTVSWDVANPAQALLSLCSELGCRIVLGLDNKLRIVRNGQGRQLPDLQTLLGGGDGISGVEIPDGIAVVCGPDRWQCLLDVEAVGLDVDEIIKPIDELSYRPAGGWNVNPLKISVENNRQVKLKNGSYVYPADLANQSVYRWYRVKENQKVPELNRPVRRQDILLRSTLNEYYRDSEGGQRERPPYGYGSCWYPSLEASNFKNQTEGLKVNLSVAVDARQYLFMFPEPVASFVNSQFSKPSIKVMASFELFNKEFQPTRNRREASLGGGDIRSGGRKLRILRHDEIVVKRTADVNGKVSTNFADVDKECDYYLQAASREYQNLLAQTRPYPTIVPIEPDGLISQVTWTVGLGGATTLASLNTEHDRYVPNYRDQEYLAANSLQIQDSRAERARIQDLLRFAEGVA